MVSQTEVVGIILIIGLTIPFIKFFERTFIDAIMFFLGFQAKAEIREISSIMALVDATPSNIEIEYVPDLPNKEKIVFRLGLRIFGNRVLVKTYRDGKVINQAEEVIGTNYGICESENVKEMVGIEFAFGKDEKGKYVKWLSDEGWKELRCLSSL